MRLTPEDELAIRRVSGLTIAPDGSAAVFALDEADLTRNSRTTRLWICDRDGRDTRPLTIAGGNQRSPIWSPEGQMIAFVGSGPGGDRLMVVSVQGGRPRQLVGPSDGFVASGIGGGPRGEPAIAWSPDSRQLACLLRVGEAVPGELGVDGPRPTGDPMVTTEITERRRGGPPVCLCVVDVESGAVSEIGRAERPPSHLTWVPDGSGLYAVSRSAFGSVGPISFRLLRYQAGRAEPEVVAEFSGAGFAPVPSPDGSRFAVAAARGTTHAPSPCLLLLDQTGAVVRELSRDDLTTYSDLAWAAGGSSLFAVADSGVRRRLVRIDVESGETTPLTPERPWVEMARLSADGSTIAYIGSALDDPGEIYMVGTNGGEPRRITNLNPQLAGFELAPGSAITWQARDGATIEGILLLPPGRETGSPDPLIIDYHGGPASHVTLGWSGPRQVFAAAGYAVFAPNFRGGTGYGAAFSEALRGDLGGVTLADSLDGIDHLVAERVADPNRLFAYGHSWGGFMTNWTITHTDRFRAVVSSGSICDLVSVFNTRYSADVWEWRLKGTPWNALDEYRKWSAILYADRVKTPTLFINGAEDRTTPPTQGLEMFTALRKHDVPAEYVVYPREGHPTTEPAHYVDRLHRILGWFERWSE